MGVAPSANYSDCSCSGVEAGTLMPSQGPRHKNRGRSQPNKNSAILWSMLWPFPLPLVEELEPKERLSPSSRVFTVVLLKQGP